MVVDIDENQEVQTKGIIQLCTNTINLYQNGILSQSVPCIISKSITLKNEENKYITTVDNEFYLTVSNNLITQQIKVNDIYKIGIYNYLISSVPDDISQQGLLIFKVKYSEQEQEVHTYTIEILNGTTLDIQEGTTLQLNCNVYDNGSLISPTPSLTFTSSDETICAIDENGLVTAQNNINSCTITVSLASDNSILDTININVIAVPQDNYTYTLSSTSLPDTEIVVSQTKTYQSQKYNNGSPVAQTFTFNIVGDVISYQLTVVDGNNCSVKALKSGYTITLNAVDDSDNSRVISKNIILKNLF